MSLDTLPATHLLVRCRMDAPEVHPIAGGTVAAFSTASPTRETDNEDAAILITAGADRAVLAVADGLGGQRGGAQAAELALATLAECVGDAAPSGDGLRSSILDGIERANQRLAEQGAGGATTLAAVEIDGASMRPYHVGDSMILAVGQRSKLKLCTVSHSPVGYALEAGLLDEAEAMNHEDRHLVSNVVGTKEMRIEVGRTLLLRPRDTVLLGSDGLFDNLHLGEIVELVRKGPLERAAAALADGARRRMSEPEPGSPSKPDDLTFLLYRPGRPGRG
jgi:serine/threonine protein phosphatase PrpC